MPCMLSALYKIMIRWVCIPIISNDPPPEAKSNTTGYHDSLSPSRSTSKLSKPLRGCLKNSASRLATEYIPCNSEAPVHGFKSVAEATEAEKYSDASYADFIARFSPQKELNKGNIGVATRVLDRITGRVVVLKQYNANYQGLINEMLGAGTLTTAKHRMGREESYLRCSQASPYIIGLLDSFIDPLHPSHTTLVLEYAEHGDLYEYSQQLYRAGKSISEPLIWHWLLQMAKAIRFLHNDLGEDAIIHCDIKPENWLLTDPYRPSTPRHRQHRSSITLPDIKLTDFDLARFERDGPKPLAGTPACQPPEHPRDTKAADVWAVGACIHRLTTGSFPIQQPRAGWASLETERQLLAHELSAPRMVEDARRWGYSGLLQVMVEGRHVEFAGGQSTHMCGGMLNLEAERRFTAVELVRKIELITVERTGLQSVSNVMAGLEVDSEKLE